MMESFNGVFMNKTVLVTGHTGFKGSWLSIWLRELGANVVGYALDPYTSEDNFVVTGLAEKITDIRGDVRDFENLLTVFKQYNPVFVFHLAAQPLVRLSYEKPRETYETNVMGTVNVLEAARQTSSVKAFINVTSDKCYENREWVWGYRENEPMGGHDPYSSSKGCSELVTAAFRNSFLYDLSQKQSFSLASARAGNVIGGGDWAKDRLIPDCIRSLRKNEPIKIRNPHATRPWQHVLEPLSGYLLLAEKMYLEPGKYEGAWNFGPESKCIIPVGKIVDMVVEKWGKGIWEDLSDNYEPHEASLLSLDINKAGQGLGWTPRWNIEKAISCTVEWNIAFEEQKDMYSVVKKQIEEFCNVPNQ